MQHYFKKYFWTLQLAAVAALALLLAGATSAFVARFWLTPFTLAVPESAPAKAGPRPDDHKPRPQLANITPEPPVEAAKDKCADVECRPEEVCNPETGACEPAPDEAGAAGDGPCPESDIAIALVGTMVAAGDSQWSIAVLRNPSTSKTEFARIGSNLLNEATVESIERNRLWITRQGKRECLRPGSGVDKGRGNQPGGRPGPGGKAPIPVASAAAVPGAPAVAAASTGGGSIEDRIRTGVTASGPNTYSIDRSILREVATNSKLLQEQAPRVAPYYEGGKPRGFRLQGLKSSGIFSAIGIRNGDVIVSVNGNPVDSPQRALDLYQNLMTQPSLSVTVLRRGKEETMSYAVK